MQQPSQSAVESVVAVGADDSRVHARGPIINLCYADRRFMVHSRTLSDRQVLRTLQGGVAVFVLGLGLATAGLLSGVLLRAGSEGPPSSIASTFMRSNLAAGTIPNSATAVCGRRRPPH